jgi:hypothetical protein
MVVGVGFCKIKVDSNFLLVSKIKCTKFHQDRSKTVDLHTKYANRDSVLYIYIDLILLSRTNNHLPESKTRGWGVALSYPGAPGEITHGPSNKQFNVTTFHCPFPDT